MLLSYFILWVPSPFPSAWFPLMLWDHHAHFLLWLCLSLACCYRPSSTITQVQTRGFRVFRILPCFPPWHLPPAVILIPLAALGLQPPDLWFSLPWANWISHVIQGSLSCWESSLLTTSKSQISTQLCFVLGGAGGFVPAAAALEESAALKESALWPLACCRLWSITSSLDTPSLYLLY